MNGVNGLYSSKLWKDDWKLTLFMKGIMKKNRLVLVRANNTSCVTR